MTRRPAALHPVAVLSRWTGYCLPCGDEARPLVLTWTGLRGVRAWLAGSSFTDGELRLTCACCGGVDVVGWEDEPALPVTPDVAAPSVPERVEVPVEQPVLLPAGPVVLTPPVREVHAELQALLGGRVDVPVTWHQPEPQAALETGPPVQAQAEPVAEVAAPLQTPPAPVASVPVAAAPVEPVPVAAAVGDPVPVGPAVGDHVPVAPAPVDPAPVAPAAVAPVPVPAPAVPAPRDAAPPAPAVVRVVQVLDLDAPAAGALRAVAEVPPPRPPSRAERRAAERAARRAPAPRGASDADALDLLDLVG